MIPISRLLYKIDQRLNKLSTQYHQSISREDKILALNQAQINLVKNKIGLNNNYQLGLDAFKKRYHDLQNLVEPGSGDFLEIKSVPTNVQAYSAYRADLSSLDPSMILLLDVFTKATKESCTDRVVVVTDLIKHGDIGTYYNNSNYKPSFEYQSTFAVLSGNNLVTFTDGTFSITETYITYLRYPKKMGVGGYDDFDGPTVYQDCELDLILEDELLDLAILDLALSTENIPAIQATDIRLKTNE